MISPVILNCLPMVRYLRLFPFLSSLSFSLFLSFSCYPILRLANFSVISFRALHADESTRKSFLCNFVSVAIKLCLNHAVGVMFYV